MRSGLALAGLALGFSLAPGGIATALGQEGKIAEGREIALKVCAVCHGYQADAAIAYLMSLKPGK
jgi:mono/diheme cytochrome c family protein